MREPYVRLIVGVTISVIMLWNIVYGLLVAGLLLALAVVHFDEPNPLKALWKARGIIVGLLLYFAAVGFSEALGAESVWEFILGGVAFVLGVIGAYLNIVTVEVSSIDELEEDGLVEYVYGDNRIRWNGDGWIVVKDDGRIMMFDSRDEMVRRWP